MSVHDKKHNDDPCAPYVVMSLTVYPCQDDDAWRCENGLPPLDESSDCSSMQSKDPSTFCHHGQTFPGLGPGTNAEDPCQQPNSDPCPDGGIQTGIEDCPPCVKDGDPCRRLSPAHVHPGKPNMLQIVLHVLKMAILVGRLSPTH